MKKIFFGVLFLLSVSMFSQETFVKKYTSMISKMDGVFQPWEKINLTVVFNPKKETDIVLYYSSGKRTIFHQINSATEDKTVDGQGYQIINCIDQDGASATLQLFDDGTCLRILIAKGYMIEFHND